MRWFGAAWVVGCIICVTSPAAAWVQATAQISGTVRDASGAVLPGVQRRHIEGARVLGLVPDRLQTVPGRRRPAGGISGRGIQCHQQRPARQSDREFEWRPVR